MTKKTAAKKKTATKKEEAVFTKDKLMELGEDALVATATQYGVDLTQHKSKDAIAQAILDKMVNVQSKAQINEKKDKPKERKKVEFADREELNNFLRGCESLGIQVLSSQEEPDVVYLKKGGRETCFNVNATMNHIKRAVNIFSIEPDRPIEAALAR